jgi:tetratricopeptide (TPR) repeat protein
MPDPSGIGVAFSKALDLAESLGDTEYQLRALRGLYFHHTTSSRYAAALPFAQKFYNLASSGSDLTDRLFGERMMGSTKHFLGDHNGARRHLEQVLLHHIATDRRRDVVRFQDVIRYGTNMRVSARAYLAKILWLQGAADQAVRAAEASIDEAQATGHEHSICYALACAACPIALWAGNLAAAAHYTGVLLDHARKYGFPLWSAFGSRFQIVVDLKGGDIDTGLRLLHTAIAKSKPTFRFLTGLDELAQALGHAGRITEGLALVEAGIAQSDGGWLTPELLRLKGELLLMQNAAAAETAEDLFQQAQGEAHRQAALSWELRAATSLARLLRDQGRSAEALTILQPVYDRFIEGFGTADLMAAKQLLNELSHGHEQRPTPDS